MTRWTKALDPERYNQPRVKRAILLLAVVFFTAGVWVSLRHQPDIFDRLDWTPVLLLMAVGVPISICINTWILVLTARLIGQHIAFVSALEIGIIGSAANMFPLPGGAVVRVVGLKALGAGYRQSAGATLLVALLLAGVAFAYAGGWILIEGGGVVGLIFLASGSLVTLAGMAVAVRLAGGWWLPLLLVVLELAMVLLDALGIWWCFNAVGAGASFAQASAFPIASVVGSAVSIVPAGLGVREVVSAAIAPLVGLAASISFLAASLNRVIGLMVILPLAVALAFRNRIRRGEGQNCHR